MKNQSTKKNKNKKHDDEINFIVLVKTLWIGRRTILRSVITSTMIGLIIAIISPKQYTAYTILVPQSTNSSNSLGGLSSLASLAGFNINMNQDATELSPQLYPQIVHSTPFLLEIMNSPYTFTEVKQPVTLYQYYTQITHTGILRTIKKYTLGLPSLLLRTIKKPPVSFPISSCENIETIQLTKKQEEIKKHLVKNITLSLNEKEGYVQLSANFQEDLLTAQIVKKTQELLQKYVTNLKIEKATAQFQFIEERYNEKKKEFEKAQNELADFRDQNKNVTSAIAQTEEERLQNEYQLAYEVYSQLAKQLEQARIKVKEDTPIFSVITPVTVPNEKSKPNRPLILLIWTLWGGIIGIGIIFGKNYFNEIRKKWKEI